MVGWKSCFGARYVNDLIMVFYAICHKCLQLYSETFSCGSVDPITGARLVLLQDCYSVEQLG